MLDIVTALLVTLGLGIATPLSAVCVIPLYPGFIAFLASKTGAGSSRWHAFFLGILVVAGVILGMLSFGLLFTTVLQTGLNAVIEYVSSAAFFLLLLVGILLILNVDFSRLLPHVGVPRVRNPHVSALLFGLFFSLIVLPCNPGLIGFFLARSTLIADPFMSLAHFFFFGLGIGLPLLVLALLSSVWSKHIVSFLTTYQRWINLLVGVVLVLVSAYYLLFVFRVWSWVL